MQPSYFLDWTRCILSLQFVVWRSKFRIVLFSSTILASIVIVFLSLSLLFLSLLLFLYLFLSLFPSALILLSPFLSLITLSHLPHEYSPHSQTPRLALKASPLSKTSCSSSSSVLSATRRVSLPSAFGVDSTLWLSILVVWPFPVSSAIF